MNNKTVKSLVETTKTLTHNIDLYDDKNLVFDPTIDGILGYVAFGDSITAPENSYVKYVADYLKSISEKPLVYGNFGVGGLDSYNLLSLLTDKKNPYYANVMNAVCQCDVITIDIGSNDLTNAVYQIAAEAFGCKVEELPSIIEDWTKKSQTSNPFLALLYYYQAQQIAKKIHDKLYDGKTLDETFLKFKNNFAQIVKRIKTINPYTKLYIGNLYNPFVDAPPLMLGTYEIANIDSLVEKYIIMYNEYINKNEYGATKVINIYKLIRGDKYTLADWKTNQFEIHPNDEGQKLIGNEFIKHIALGKY